MLARNYSAGPRWVQATIVAQTGPVSYTVQTADGRMWRRHVDQLLQSVASTHALSSGDCGEDLLESCASDPIVAPVGLPAHEVPVPDPPSEMLEGLAPPSPAALLAPPRDSLAGPLSGDIRVGSGGLPNVWTYELF